MAETKLGASCILVRTILLSEFSDTMDIHGLSFMTVVVSIERF